MGASFNDFRYSSLKRKLYYEKEISGDIFVSEVYTKLMTQNVALELNEKRKFNIIACSRTNVDKTRLYCKPNLMKSRTDFVILDSKGEILRDVENLLIAKGYEIKVLDLINMEKVMIRKFILLWQVADDLYRETKIEKRYD